MIEIKNLEKRYGTHLAVDNLTFSVEKGEIVGLLGPNGAGKSTTMNMMSGYLPFTKGTVCMNGYDMKKEAKRAKKSIGYLPEQPPLYLDFTVKEYLNFVAGLKKLPRDTKKTSIEKVSEKMQLNEVKNRLIRQLSKGYRQRIGIASAMLGDPQILILDEPTSGLDPKQITMIREYIKELKINHTIVLSSHILSEVSAICDRILIVHHGKLVADGSMEKLMERVAKRVGAFVTIKGEEEVIMNYLKGIKGVQDIIKQPSIPGYVSAVLYTKKEEEIREIIFYGCAKSKLPIYEIRREEVTLEDAFLALTREENVSLEGRKEEA